MNIYRKSLLDGPWLRSSIGPPINAILTFFQLLNDSLWGSLYWLTELYIIEAQSLNK